MAVVSPRLCTLVRNTFLEVQECVAGALVDDATDGMHGLPTFSRSHSCPDLSQYSDYADGALVVRCKESTVEFLLDEDNTSTVGSASGEAHSDSKSECSDGADRSPASSTTLSWADISDDDDSKASMPSKPPGSFVASNAGPPGVFVAAENNFFCFDGCFHQFFQNDVGVAHDWQDPSMPDSDSTGTDAFEQKCLGPPGVLSMGGSANGPPGIFMQTMYIPVVVPP